MEVANEWTHSLRQQVVVDLVFKNTFSELRRSQTSSALTRIKSTRFLVNTDIYKLSSVSSH